MADRVVLAVMCCCDAAGIWLLASLVGLAPDPPLPLSTVAAAVGVMCFTHMVEKLEG